MEDEGMKIIKIGGKYCPKCKSELDIIKRKAFTEGSMSCRKCKKVFWLTWNNYPKCLQEKRLEEIFLE